MHKLVKATTLGLALLLGTTGLSLAASVEVTGIRPIVGDRTIILVADDDDDDRSRWWRHGPKWQYGDWDDDDRWDDDDDDDDDDD